MDDFEKELKVGFLDEAAQLLADAEQCFLNLETASDDPSIVEKIFRLAHNLKGSARAVGFGQMAEFTHQLESLLLKIKNKEMAIQASTVSLLLLCNDHLNQMVHGLKANQDATFESTALMQEIGRHLAGQASAAPAATAVPTPEPAAPAPEPEAASPEPEHPGFQDTANTLLDDSQQAAPPADAFQDLEAVVQNSLHVQAPAPTAAQAPQAAAAATAVDESIRVSLKRLDRLMNNVGELVILQAVLNQQKFQVQSLLVQKTIDQLAKITKDIQDISMSLRMVPLKQTFQKMQRIVRDVSKTLNKDVRFETVGEETELDKTVLEQIGDPLVHLVRNAVDHGLESTEDRLLGGKSAHGTVRLMAINQGDHIVIEVREDGRGLDPKKLIAKAIEKGILRPGTTMPDEQAYQLIFASGFSTKSEISDISGRGVGLDVVRANVAALQGEIQVDTEVGKGTCFRILLPLTLSIIDGMVIRAGEDRFVVPINHVHESVQPTLDDLQFVTGLGEVLTLRGENLPLFRLGPLLGKKTQNDRPIQESIAIVIRVGKHPFAVLVDDIIGQQQVVIKRLGSEVQSIKGIAGGAILGDGRAALILDMPVLSTRAVPAKVHPKEYAVSSTTTPSKPALREVA